MLKTLSVAAILCWTGLISTHASANDDPNGAKYRALKKDIVSNAQKFFLSQNGGQGKFSETHIYRGVDSGTSAVCGVFNGKPFYVLGVKSGGDTALGVAYDKGFKMGKSKAQYQEICGKGNRISE